MRLDVTKLDRYAIEQMCKGLEERGLNVFGLKRRPNGTNYLLLKQVKQPLFKVRQGISGITYVTKKASVSLA